MIEDMIQLKLAVEGMKAEIVKCFESEKIAKAIEIASHKAVTEFNLEEYIKETIESVFYQAKESVIVELGQKYGEKWSDDLSQIIDKKIEQALNEAEKL